MTNATATPGKTLLSPGDHTLILIDFQSAGQITRLQRLADNDADYVTPADMLAELRDDNARLTGFMRATHALCDEYGDVATASLLEGWIDEAERRIWFLFEAGRHG